MMVLQARLTWLDLNGEPVLLFGVTQPNPATRGETRHGQTVTWPSFWVHPQQKKVPCR